MNAIIFIGLPNVKQWAFRSGRGIKNKRIQYNDKLEIILDEVCKYMNVSVGNIKSISKTIKSSMPRHYYVYLSLKFTKASNQEIGRVIHRHRATVISSRDNIKTWLKYDKEVIKQLEEIETNIERRLKKVCLLENNY